MNMVHALWMSAGLIAFAVGTIGILLPILPTVPFYLLAAFCFSRSNPVWEQRLLDHPHWGPPIRNWRERRAIGRTAKLAAITGMTGSVFITGYFVGPLFALVPLTVLLTVGPWIWTRAE